MVVALFATLYSVIMNSMRLQYRFSLNLGAIDSVIRSYFIQKFGYVIVTIALNGDCLQSLLPTLEKTMNENTAKVIAETSRLQVLYQPGEDDCLLMTFSGLQSRADGESFVGQPVATSLNMPAIGFMPKQGNWYPRADIEEVLPKLEWIFSKYPRRISYGFSMGGYGAIKHSRILGATYVLAMSPQWSIRPEVAPWERRYLNFLDECVESMEIVREDCAGKIYLIYDNLNHDSNHAERIAAATDIVEIPAPLAGHNTWSLFLSSATMRGLFDAIFAGDVPRIHRIVRERRRLVPDLEARLFWASARRYLRLNRFDEAEQAARRADQSTKRVPGAAWLLTAILIELNRPEEAEAVIRLEMERFPKIRWLGVHLVRALEAQGRLQDALDALAPMLASHPNNSDMKRYANQITRKLHAQRARMAASPPRPGRATDNGPVWRKAAASVPAAGL